MTFVLLVPVVGLAALVVGVALGGLAIALADRLTATRRWSRLGARTRAAVLAQARLAPLTLGFTATALVVTAFWRFEPRTPAESMGLPLAALALAGAAIASGAAVRVARALRATAAIAGSWRRAGDTHPIPGWTGPAWVVDTVFPVVAVVGVRRAELFVSSTVLAACSSAELAAIAAHERAHVAARDNLVRVGFAAAPAVGAAARRLEGLWAATAEECADLAARAAGDGVTLARALTKVARLAVGESEVPALAASAFIGADGLERRVRRLLEPARHPGRVVPGVSAAALTAVAAAAIRWGLPALYDATEFVVALGR